jgi:hypothetical protein
MGISSQYVLLVAVAILVLLPTGAYGFGAVRDICTNCT